jgi:chromatin-remodeling ATPase INO80
MGMYIAMIFMPALTVVRSDIDFAAHFVAPMGKIRKQISYYLEVANDLPPLNLIGSTFLSTSYLSRPEIRWHSEAVSAPPIMLQCTSRTFLDRTTNMLSSPLTSLSLYGLPNSHAFSPSSVTQLTRLLPNIHPLGLLRSSPRLQMPWSPMQVPDGKRLIYDSSKLAKLDELLQELKAGDHRVLIYFQMTKMMDLMEEYLVFRQYKYLRLDGSSKLEDRRDMVLDWQTR